MLTKEEFIELGSTEQLWAIYSSQFKSDEGGVAGVFGKKEPRATPVAPKQETPPGFEAIFGEEPPKSDSSHRVGWMENLAKFEGLIDIETRMDYLAKANRAQQLDLGIPIAYRFAGQDRITFSQKNNKFFRPLNWYTDSFEVLATIARNA